MLHTRRQNILLVQLRQDAKRLDDLTQSTITFSTEKANDGAMNAKRVRAVQMAVVVGNAMTVR